MSYYHRNDRSFTQPLTAISLPTADIEQARKDDAIKGGNRFALSLPANISNKENEGTWTDIEGGRIWRTKIQSPGAVSLSLGLKDFYIAPGASLYLYSPDYKQIIGGYTSLNNTTSGEFFMGFIQGEEAVLEYFEPSQSRGQGHITVEKVYHGYNTLGDEPMAGTGFGSSEPCNVNVNCAEGAAYQNVKKSVCRIFMVMQEGVIYCSGTLMNNTKNDGKPYVLTAYHCHDGYNPEYNKWRFDFNYESPDCANPATEDNIEYNSLLGCLKVSGKEESDFLLLLLSIAKIPACYDVYFSGWNKIASYFPTDVAFIHHPKGDIKKISIDHDKIEDQPNEINWNNGAKSPVGTHYLVKSDIGMMEGGSSGCALYDQNMRVIGQLHGGKNTCNPYQVDRQWFGMLSKSWATAGLKQERVQDWLDPAFTNVGTLDGIPNPSGLDNKYTVKLKVTTAGGIGIPNLFTSNQFGQCVNVAFDQATGVYTFSNIPEGTSLIFAPVKINNYLNGVSTVDVAAIIDHIVKIKALSAYGAVAADVNVSGKVSAGDIHYILRLLNGSATTLPSDSWVFDPPVVEISHISQDENRTIIGIKMGDVDSSNDPSK